MNAHRALDRKKRRHSRGGTEQKALRSGYRGAAEINEATAPQIAAQNPSDNSNVTIKDAPVSGG
jgi:hypothetical protein